MSLQAMDAASALLALGEQSHALAWEDLFLWTHDLPDDRALPICRTGAQARTGKHHYYRVEKFGVQWRAAKVPSETKAANTLLCTRLFGTEADAKAACVQHDLVGKWL